MELAFRQLQPTDWQWVQRYIPGLKQVEDTTGIIAIDVANNCIVGAVVMDTWTHTSVCVHQILTSPMILRHGFFEEVADYVYNVAGREVMIGLVPGANEKALKLNKRIGFVERGRVPDAIMLGQELIIMSMHKEQCIFWSAPPEPDLDTVFSPEGTAIAPVPLKNAM